MVSSTFISFYKWCNDDVMQWGDNDWWMSLYSSRKLSNQYLKTQRDYRHNILGILGSIAPWHAWQLLLAVSANVQHPHDCSEKFLRLFATPNRLESYIRLTSSTALTGLTTRTLCTYLALQIVINVFLNKQGLISGIGWNVTSTYLGAI